MISSMTLLRATVGLIACTACVAQGAGLPNKAFGAILQEDIQWAPFPAFPAQARLAVLVEIGRASCRKECRSRWSPYH